MLFPVISTTMDIYGITVCLVLLWCLRRGTLRKKKLNRIFLWMCVFNIGTLLGDIPNWLCEGKERVWYPAALWSGCLVLYLCSFLLLLAYSQYVICYLEERCRVHKGFLWMVNALGITGIVLVLLTQFNGMLYYIDEGNFYHRGRWYLFSQLLAVMIMLTDTVMIIGYRKYLRKKELGAFSGYIVLPVAAIVIQYFFYGLSVSYTASTIAILVIFIDIQSEQAYLMEQLEKKVLKDRISMLLSQVKPHFLYNSLITIAHLCTSDSALAREETLNFARYLRGKMDSIGTEGNIPFSRELEHTKFYLSMEELRYKERLKVEYSLETVAFEIPPLALQTIVENAVRHGAMKRADGGVVKIITQETAEAWLVKVWDNGPGFDGKDISIRDGVKHVGLYNVEQRVECLCAGKLEIESSPGRGTCVTVRLPKGREKKDESDSGG